MGGDIELIHDEDYDGTLDTKQLTRYYTTVFYNIYTMYCTSFDDLPDSIILHIFKHFPLTELFKISLLSRRWLTIAHDKDLWLCTDFSKFYKKTDEFISLLVDRQLISQVKIMDLSNTSLNFNILYNITEKCLSLETLILRACNVKKTIYDNLKCVRFPEKLIELDMRDSETVSDFINPLQLIKNQENLQSLGYSNITLKDFEQHFQNKVALRIFECTNCITISDRHLISLADFLPFLEAVSLKQCKGITGSTLPYLITISDGIKSLNLSGTDLCDAALLETPWEMSKIEELNLTGCDLLTEAGISNSIWKIKTLRTVVLNVVGRGKAVTSTLFENSFKNNTWLDLREIGLKFSCRLQPEGIAKLRLCKYLKRLSLRSCRFITFDVITNNLKYLPELISLECGSLFQADEACNQWIDLINEVSIHCKNMQYLTLIKCAEVSVEDRERHKTIVCKFMQSCTKLVAISVLYSENALVKLFQQCAKSEKSTVIITSSKENKTIQPFKHSLDFQMMKRKRAMCDSI